MSAEKKVRNRLKKVNEPTRISGKSVDKAAENSYFSVYDLEFSEPTKKEEAEAAAIAERNKGTRKDAVDKLTVTISGNEFAIALQASLLDAMRDLIRYELKKIDISGSKSDRNSDVRMLSKHPKLYLYFEEERSNTKIRPRDGKISIRLMNETDDTISTVKLKKIAAKIKEIFGGSSGYFWEKGKRYANYNHWELGYKLQLLSPSIAKAEVFIQDILRIQGHEFAKTRMTYSQNQAEAQAFPAKPSKKRVLGEEVDLPARRPNCKVKFRYAYVEIGALNQEIIIFSLDKNKPVDSRLKG